MGDNTIEEEVVNGISCYKIYYTVIKSRLLHSKNQEECKIIFASLSTTPKVGHWNNGNGTEGVWAMNR